MRNTSRLFVFAFIFIFLLAAVSAIRYETEAFRYAILNSDGSVTLTTTPVSGVNVKGYVCASANCGTIQGNLYSGSVLSTSTDTITLDFPTNLQSSFGYGLIMYKDGYIPYEVTANYFGTNPSDPVGPVSRYLAQQQSCLANITSMSVTNSSNTITVSGTVAAPTNAGGLVSYSPPELQSYYTTNVDLLLNVTGAQNSTQSTSTGIVFSGNNVFSFTVPVSANGNYTLAVTSTPNDAKCISSSVVQSLRSTSLTINSSAFNPPVPPIVLTVQSPQNISYANNSILVNITSANVANVWYSINGNTNTTYTSPFVFSFPNGTNTFAAYANNTAGTLASSLVSFGVNVGGLNNTNSTNSTLPTNSSGAIFLTVNSPQANVTYNNSVPVNISSVNASNIWFTTNNGLTNTTYTVVTSINLSDASYNFIVYANNTNNSTSITIPIIVNGSFANNTNTNSTNTSNPCTANCGGSNPSSGGGGGGSSKIGKTLAAKAVNSDGEAQSSTSIFEEEEGDLPESSRKALSYLDWAIIMLIILSILLAALILLIIGSRRD